MFKLLLGRFFNHLLHRLVRLTTKSSSPLLFVIGKRKILSSQSSHSLGTHVLLALSPNPAVSARCPLVSECTVLSGLDLVDQGAFEGYVETE